MTTPLIPNIDPMNSLTIIQVCRFFHPHLGGVETHVWQTSQILTHQGHQVHVITLQDQNQLPLHQTLSKIKIWRIKSFPLVTKVFPNWLNKLKYKLHIWQWVWQHRHLFMQADIIQVHDVMWWLLPIYPWIRSKTYLTFHGWEGIFPIPLSAKLQRRFWNWLARASLHVGAWIEEFYGDKPDQVTYGGVEAKKHLPVKRTASDQKLKLVFLGRLEAENNIQKYLDFVKYMRQTLVQTGKKELSVTWLGDGAWRDRCAQEGRVVGFKSDVSRYIQAADIVMAASYLSILEAQGQGKVVVALYAHPLKKRYLETFLGYPYLLAGSQANLVGQKFVKLIKNQKKWQTVEHQARQFALGQTWQQVVSSYQKLWQTSVICKN